MPAEKKQLQFYGYCHFYVKYYTDESWVCLVGTHIIKRPLWGACLCMGDLQAPAAPHFVFLITL